MAFTNDDKQEIKAIVQEVIDEQADPIEDTTQVDALEEGDIVAIVRAVGGVNSYKKASVGLFGGGSGSIKVDSHLDITSTNPVQNKVVTTALNGKQATLIGSGTGQNIKTVNGQSLLGTGDIPVSGGAGTVPVITATATVDATTGTPAVSVVKSGTDAAPNFAFAFTGLKGEPGGGGGGGGTGTVTGAKVGQEGTPINPDQNGVLTFPAYEANADVTDAENVKNALGVQQGGTRYLKEDGSWDTPAGGGGGTQKGTKVYLAANGGVLPAMESTNVVYVISYAYTISGSVTVPAGCALEFAGGSIDGGTLVLNGTYLYGNIKFGTGITISGTCKNGTVYQKWFDGNNVDAWHRFINNVDGPSCYEYTAGEYTTTIRVLKEIENRSSITINGNNAIVKFPYEAKSRAIDIQPKNADTSSSSQITSAAYNGDTEITVASGSVFSVGDIVSVRDNTECSFSPFRTSYKQCEFATIRSISSNTLTLAHPLYGRYVNIGSSTKAHTMRTISCTINDLVVGLSEPSSVADSCFGIVIEQSAGGSLNNVKVNNFRYNIVLYSCMNMIIEGCNSRVTNNQGTGNSVDSYGMSLGNCQNVSVIGGEFMGGNHAVSIGGADNSFSAISRNIVIKNVRAYSIRDGFPNAIDMHGNTEFITIEGCTTHGIYLRGRNNNILNNFIYGSDISCGELANYNHNIKGNILKDARISIVADELAGTVSGTNYVYNSGVTWFTSGGDSTVEDNFVISGNKTYDDAFTGSGSNRTYQFRFFVTSGIGLEPYTKVKDGVTISYPGYAYHNQANTTLIIEDNAVRNCVLSSGGFNKVVLKGNTFSYDSSLEGSVKSKPKLYGTDVFIENNRFFGYGKHPYCTTDGAVKTWSFFNISASKCYIRNNYAESSVADEALFNNASSMDELYVEGNIAKEGKFLLFSQSSTKIGLLVARNNTLEHTTQGVYIQNTSASYSCDAIIMNNIMSAKKSVLILYAGKVVYGRNILKGTFALTEPHIGTYSTEPINLDASSGGGTGVSDYADLTYSVATSSYNGNTSGSVTIDGTKALTIIAITGDVTSLSLASGKTPAAGHSSHVILSASSARSVTVVHNSTSCVCPKAANLTLSVPAGGYAEVDFINANDKIYARGV